MNIKYMQKYIKLKNMKSHIVNFKKYTSSEFNYFIIYCSEQIVIIGIASKM